MATERLVGGAHIIVICEEISYRIILFSGGFLSSFYNDV